MVTKVLTKSLMMTREIIAQSSTTRYVINHALPIGCPNNCDQPETPDDADLFTASLVDTPTPASHFPPLMFQESRNLGLMPSSRATSTLAPHSKASTLSTCATSGSQKTQGKCSCQEAFADKNKAEAEIIATLAAKKHAWKMVEHEQYMVELQIKKQKMDLDANEK